MANPDDNDRPNGATGGSGGDLTGSNQNEAADEWDDVGAITNDFSDSDLSRGGGDLTGAWEDDSDLEERDDATTVDGEVARQLREEEEADPVSIDSGVFDQTGSEVVELDPSETDPPPLEADLNRLGPAFPHVEEDSSSASSAVERPGDVETSRKPGAQPDDGASNGWDGFEDESSGGWPRVTTGSGVAVDVGPEPAEREYSRRDTNVYKLGEPVAASEEVARLVGTAGADTGREFAVNDREISIGRVPANDIVLTDHSVSREHARLLNRGESFVLVDLRSANGTFVNGQRVDRARVRSGDEIGFGSTRFRFLEIGDVFKPVDARGAPVLPGARPGVWHRLRQSPHFRSVVISASILMVTLALTVVILMVRNAGGGRSQHDTIFQYYLQGVEAFKRRDWATAEAQFSIIRGLDSEHEQAKRYLEAISNEKKFEVQLATARRSRANGDLAEAYVLASAIVDSLYSPEANELLRDIDAELDARVARARASLASGNAREALELLVSVDRVRPGRPDVLALRDRAAGELESSGEGSVPAPRVESPSPSPRPEPPKPARAEPPRAPRPAPVERSPSHADKPRQRTSAVERAVNLVSDGKTAEALRALDAAGDGRDVKVLRAKIEKFNEVYARAIKEHRNKRTQTAIKQLRQAKGFALKIVGPKSGLVHEIQRKLADMYYVEGIGARLAGRYAEAYRSFQAGVDASSGHSQSMRQLKLLAGKAKELYEDGYRLKEFDPEAARKHWKTVLQIVPPTNEYYGKAKKRLDELP